MGRPSRKSDELWAKAKALYQADKSLREIEKETGIEYSQIGKKARSEGWERGVLPQLIDDSIRVNTQFATLNLPQQQVVANEVDRIMGFRKKRNTIADIAYNRIETELQKCDPYLIKNLVEATDKVGVMVEIAPRHPTQASPVQNNIGFNFNLEDRDQNMQRLKKLIAGNIIDA